MYCKNQAYEILLCETEVNCSARFQVLLIKYLHVTCFIKNCKKVFPKLLTKFLIKLINTFGSMYKISPLLKVSVISEAYFYSIFVSSKKNKKKERFFFLNNFTKH